MLWWAAIIVNQIEEQSQIQQYFVHKTCALEWKYWLIFVEIKVWPEARDMFFGVNLNIQLEHIGREIAKKNTQVCTTP